MSDDLVISGLVLWMTLGAIACGALESVTAVDGIGITVWFGGVVLAAIAAVAVAVCGAFRD